MTKLNQIIALEPDVRATAERAKTTAYHGIQATTLLNGRIRTFKRADDDGETFPDEREHVQTEVEALLRDFAKGSTRLFDVTFTKEFANTKAKADVIVDGTTLVKDAPVGYLLFLAKQLIDVRTFVSSLPTLDAKEKWSWNADASVWQSEPSQTNKGKKINEPLVLAPATDKHPAQVQLVTKDVHIGVWTTILQSGAIPGDRKVEILERFDRLIESVKVAREEANQHEVVDKKAGEAVFNFLFKK